MTNEKRTLFKYASLNSAIKIVKSGSVVLNPPSKFNDPFDSNIYISEKAKKKTLDLIFNYFAFIEFAKFVKRTDIKLTNSQKVLFALLRKEVAAMSFLIRKTMRYEPVPLFDRALRRFGKEYHELGEAIDESVAMFRKDVIPSILSFREKARISCFSRRNDSILMWSHYANSHAGVCIEFEESRPFFKDVVYSDKHPELDLYSVFARTLAYGFTKQHIDMRDKEYAKVVLEPFIHKSADWKYEEEVRCILSDTEPNTPGYKFDGERVTLDMAIKRILIGPKASGDELNELLLAAQHRDIPVVFMKNDEKLFKVVPDQNKAVPIKGIKRPKKNVVQEMLDEIGKCIDSGYYYAAIALALEVPTIMGRVIFPELGEKERYVAWFQDRIGQFESCGPSKMPYLSGEVCWAIRESIKNEGKMVVTGKFGDFYITELKLMIEPRNPFGLYGSKASVGQNPAERSVLELSVRDLCNKLSWSCQNDFETKPELTDIIPSFSVYRFDLALDEMMECNAMNEALKKRLSQ